MMVCRLPLPFLHALGNCRVLPQWEVAPAAEADGGGWWVRFPDDPESRRLAGSLPFEARYFEEPGGGLVRPSGKVPVLEALVADWQPLRDWLPVDRPPALWPGSAAGRVPIRLERHGGESPAAALETDLQNLLAWADHASRLRLERLRFAAADDGRVRVLGGPLPPVMGTGWYAQGALMLPCGWSLAPPLQPLWVEQSLSLPQGSTAWMDPEGKVELIPEESWLPFSLGALRRTHTRVRDP